MTKLEINPDIDLHELARFFGGRNTATFSSRVSLKIEQMIKIFRKRLRPQLYYRRMCIQDVKDGSVHLGKGPVLKSRKLSRVMKDCKAVICFIATIGPGIEAEIKKLMDEKKLSAAYILDSMGSVAVEDIVEKFHTGMGNQLRAKEQGVTLRFSPGYCDWPIADQKKLFRIFHSLQLGVQLNDSCLMQPRKSVSGVFGLMSENPVPSRGPYNPCSVCKQRGCIARRQ
jgi:hypothetical protein